MSDVEIVKLFERSKLRENLKHGFKQGIIRTKTALLEQTNESLNEQVLLGLLEHLMNDSVLIDSFVDGLTEGVTKGVAKAEHVVENPPTLVTSGGAPIEPKKLPIEKPKLTIVE